MQNNDLIELRELLQSEKGKLLLCYLTDYMVEMSVKSNADAEWIKGMGMLINRLRQIDEVCRQFNETNRR